MVGATGGSEETRHASIEPEEGDDEQESEVDEGIVVGLIGGLARGFEKEEGIEIEK